jgi:DNA-binding SARP family transcriptional activator
MLKVHLLGQFDVKRDLEAIEIPSRPAQSLLAYLILSAGKAHRREKLAGLLWPEANEENARSNLRHALWRLRKAIGSEYLIADKISIAFNEESDYWLDAANLVAGNEELSEILLQTVASYGGELLPGFYDDWVVLERERLRALFEQNLQSLLDRFVEDGRWTDILEWGERWIALGQVPEPAYRALMIAHSGLGDAARMAATYKRCIKALDEELGVEPSDETKALYEWLVEGGLPSSPQFSYIQPEKHVDSDSAVKTLLSQWRGKGVEVLDLASLAIVQASPGEHVLGDQDASLLIRSALHHAVEVEPWLERAKSEEVAIGALLEVYETYPRPRVRQRIVEALSNLEAQSAGEGLLRIAIEDDAPEVRSQAAVGASRKGSHTAVVEELRNQLSRKDGAAATAAFVAVADEIGLPDDVGPYPKFSIGISLAQRRWRANSSSILRQMVKAASGGAIAMAFVAIIQLLPVRILKPDVFQENLEFTTLPIWILSNAFLGLIWGGIQGAAIGFNLGLADALWRESKKWRIGLAGMAGLVYSFFNILLSLSGGFRQGIDASAYIPVDILDGFALGVALSLAVPCLGDSFMIRERLVRSLWASLLIAIIFIPSELVLYGGQAISPITIDLIYALVFPLGMALTLGRGVIAEDVKILQNEET